MDLVQGILSNYATAKGSDESNSEKKEKLTSLEQQVEELKFYQELEENEFSEVRQKLKSYENRMDTIEKGKKRETKKKSKKEDKSRGSRSKSRVRSSNRVRSSSVRRGRDQENEDEKEREKILEREKKLEREIKSERRKKADIEKKAEREKLIEMKKNLEMEKKLLRVKKKQREQDAEMRKQDDEKRLEEEESKGVAMALAMAKIGQEERERTEKKLQGQHEKVERTLQQKLEESQAKMIEIQKDFDEQTFYKDLESKELESTKKMIKEQELQIRNTERRNEENLEELNHDFNDKMDILAKQFQKMKRREEAVLKEKEDLLEEKEIWMTSGTEEMQQTNENHAKEINELTDELEKAEDKIDEVEKNGRKNLETMKENMQDNIKLLQEKVGTEVHETLKKAETEYESKEEKSSKAIEKLNEDIKVLTQKHRNELIELKEKYEDRERDHDDNFAESEERLNVSTKTNEKLLSDLNKKETEYDEIKLQLQNKLNTVETTNEMMESQVEQYSGSLEDKEEEIAALREKLLITEKSVTLFRTRARTEMDGIKAVVVKSKEDNDELLEESIKEKTTVMNELKSLKIKFSRSQKEVDALNNSYGKRISGLNAKISDFKHVKEDHSRCTEDQQMALKNREIKYARDKKKWSMSEQRLREELAVRKLTSSRVNEDQESLAELRAMVERLKSEKSALQLQLVSKNEQSNRRIAQLEKEVSHTSFGVPTPNQVVKKRIPQTQTSATATSKYLQSSRSYSSRSFSLDEDRSLAEKVDSREPVEHSRIYSSIMNSTSSTIRNNKQRSSSANEFSDTEEDFGGELNMAVSSSSRAAGRVRRTHIRNRKFG